MDEREGSSSSSSSSNNRVHKRRVEGIKATTAAAAAAASFKRGAEGIKAEYWFAKWCKVCQSSDACGQSFDNRMEDGSALIWLRGRVSRSGSST
jgi:hypothetical protein